MYDNSMNLYGLVRHTENDALLALRLMHFLEVRTMFMCFEILVFEGLLRVMLLVCCVYVMLVFPGFAFNKAADKPVGQLVESLTSFCPRRACRVRCIKLLI